MAMTGTFTSVIDDKLRTTMPASFRPSFETGDISLVPMPTGCISVYDKAYFNKFLEAKYMAAETDEEKQKVKNLSANAFSAHFDSAGRFTVPAKLFAFAGFTTGDVVFVGDVFTCSIWTAERYEASDYAKLDTLAKRDYPSGM